jgi:hypothetical protein
MTAIAEGLADRGHEVTMVVNRNMSFDAPEVETGKHKRIFVERYEDGIDIEATHDDLTMRTLEGKLTLRNHLTHVVKLYVTRSSGCKIITNKCLFSVGNAR